MSNAIPQPQLSPSAAGQPAPSQGAQPEQQDLKQPLALALDNLVVNLDEELARYRLARRGQGAALPPRRTAFRQRRKALDLIEVKAGPAAPGQGAAATVPVPSPATPAPASLPPPPPPNPRLSQITAPPAPALEAAGALTPYAPIPEDYLETTEALLRSEYAGYDRDSEEPEYTPSLLSRLSTPLGVGALLLVLVSSGGLGYLVANPKAINHLWNHPAMQALRGQPRDGQMAAGHTAPIPGQDDLSPNLATDEFSDLNLGALNTLPGETSRQPVPRTIAPADPLAVAPPGATPAPSEGGAQASPGAIAAAIAPVTTTPITINRPTVAVPTPAASRPPAAAPAATAPRPASTSRPAAAAPAAPAPTSAPTSAAAPAPPQALPPVPAPGPLQQAAAPAEASRTRSNYYVITDYTGDQSLNSVRSVVGDAYVRNFPIGARIQMGAFQQEGSARSLVQQLQDSGIQAEVYEVNETR